MLTTKTEDELGFWKGALRRSLELKRYPGLSPAVATLTEKSKQTSI
jgi:hypothetical protein